MTGTVSMDGILAMLNSLGTIEKDWLAENLLKEISRDKDENARKRRILMGPLMNTPDREKRYQKMYDEVFERFHTDWGGDGDALKIAEELHDSHSEVRTVDIW